MVCLGFHVTSVYKFNFCISAIIINNTTLFQLQNFNLILKSKYIQGLELFDAHKTLNRSKVQETVAAAKNAILKNGGGPLLLSLPANPELLAKYYDFRILGKTVDLMMLQTHALGLMKNLTFHPSRLSGLWDMLNTVSSFGLFFILHLWDLRMKKQQILR